MLRDYRGSGFLKGYIGFRVQGKRGLGFPAVGGAFGDFWAAGLWG